MHERGDNVCLAVGHELHQVAAALRSIGRESAGGEGVAKLFVEVHAVGDEHDAWVANRRFERQRTSEHHHGQRLARALCVPDDAASAFSAGVCVPDPSQHLADGEHLLIACDLAYAAIEHGEGPGHLQQTFRPAQRVECAILFGDAALRNVRLRRLLAHAELSKSQVEQRRLHRFRKRAIKQGQKRRVGHVFFPLRPELCGRARCREARFVLVDRHDHLRIGEQARDVLVALVANGL